MWPKAASAEKSRVVFGGKACTKPFSASILNVSGMSYGALSENAILALSQAAKQGGFYHNTGEGGMSRFHIEVRTRSRAICGITQSRPVPFMQGGGDLVWKQVSWRIGVSRGYLRARFLSPPPPPSQCGHGVLWMRLGDDQARL